jgi:hypothetical protein
MTAPFRPRLSETAPRGKEPGDSRRADYSLAEPSIARASGRY